jgi:hypothetical protein
MDSILEEGTNTQNAAMKHDKNSSNKENARKFSQVKLSQNQASDAPRESESKLS